MQNIGKEKKKTESQINFLQLNFWLDFSLIHYMVQRSIQYDIRKLVKARHVYASHDAKQTRYKLVGGRQILKNVSN